MAAKPLLRLLRDIVLAINDRAAQTARILESCPEHEQQIVCQWLNEDLASLWRHVLAYREIEEVQHAR